MPYNIIMATREEIKAKVNELNWFSRLFGWVDIPAIGRVVRNGEKIEMMVEGLYHGENALLIATNERLIILNKRLFWGLKVKDFNYVDIRSVEYFAGVIFGSVSVVTEDEENELRRVFSTIDAKKMAEFIRHRCSQSKESEEVDEVERDISDIERLMKLKERGAITSEEFETEKKKILST